MTRKSVEEIFSISMAKEQEKPGGSQCHRLEAWLHTGLSSIVIQMVQALHTAYTHCMQSTSNI